MKKIIRENTQILLMVLLLFSGFYQHISSAWMALELPMFWWVRVVFVFAAAFLNFLFIIWIQKTN